MRIREEVGVEIHSKDEEKYKNRIKVMYTNADQLKNKLDEMRDRIVQTLPDIIAVNEVKPKAKGTYSLADFKIDEEEEYEIFQNNIDKAVGRGQLMLIRKSLITTEVEFKGTFNEGLFVELKLQKKDRMIAALIYRSESDGDEMSDKLVELVNEISNKGYSHIMIIGDFNYKDINWVELHSPVKVERNFLKCIGDNYLHQHVTEPTRWRGNDQPNILDLIITNEEDMISCIDYQSPIGKSDHAILVFDFECYAEENVEEFTKKKYYKADYEKMKEYVNKNTNWDELLKDKDIDEMCKEFLEVYETLESFVPVVTKKNNVKNQMPLDTKTLELIKDKTRKSRKVMRMKKRSNNNQDIERAKIEYNRARNKVRKQTRMKRKKYEEDIAADVKNNTKPVFAYMNRKCKIKYKIADLCIDPSNAKSTKTKNNKKKAEIFSKFFASVWTEEPPGPVPTISDKEIKYAIGDIEITEKKVLDKLLELKPNKTPGPDEVHPMILKNLANELVKPIKAMYKESIRSCKLAKSWKVSDICVVFKKGLKSIAGNYRPISLTSVLCKILESLIREWLIEHSLFNDKQYGFIGGRSAILQLLRVLDEWTEALDKGNKIDAIYMDYMKAFDTVPHRRLMSKVKAYGFPNYIVDWLEDFLIGRRQTVRINGESADEKEIKSGIPQGSVLGPLLFLLYVNDIPEIVLSMLYLFADDNKVWKEITCKKDKEILQHDLDKIYQWSKIWLMNIHPEKSAHIHIGQEMDIPQFEYTIGPMIVNYSTAEKDLGVTIDNNLNFGEHIIDKITKANKMAGWIRRSFQYMNKDIFVLLYKSLVRTHLEYAACVWSPYLW